MERILIIEDDNELATLLESELTKAGFEVYHAQGGLSGLADVAKLRPGLVVLDLGLPDVDGAAVLTQVRRLTEAPVIVFSGRNDLEEKVRLLQGGASDYVVKPCDPRELAARIGAQLRHHPHSPRVVGKLMVLEERELVSFDGMIVGLTPTELKLVALLAREPGRIFSREEVIREVWSGAVSPHAVNANIANIRAKFRAVGAHHLLRSVRGVGYTLLAD